MGDSARINSEGKHSVMLSAVCNEPVSLKVLEEPFYRKGFSPFVNKETGTWWEYDDDKKGFFDTGIIAQGRDGNDYVITEQDYDTIVERTLNNVNPTLDDMINVVKDDLSDLAPAGANVGQLFRVAAISEDGKYTMEPVDMLDVQVNGKSIVQDGVANIPIANEFGKTGIVRLAESLGVKWSYANGGGLSIDYASIDNIRDRASSNRPIIPYYLDYAVKAAMCDGKGEPWTSDEQAAARERMGCYNGYTVLMDTVIEEKANLIYFTLPNNTVEFIAYFELYNTKVSIEGSSYLMFANKGDVYPISKIYSYFGGVLKIGDTNIKGIQKCVIINDEDVFVEYAALSKNEEQTNQSQTRNGRVGIAKRTSNKIAFHFTGQTFPIGTRFLVLVRCK